MFSGLPSEVLTTNVELRVPDDREQESVSEEDSSLPGAITESSLVEEEEKETGVVKLEVYKSYWRAVGGCLAPSVLIALFLMQGKTMLMKFFNSVPTVEFCMLICLLLIYTKPSFSEKPFRNTIRVSNSLDANQAQHFVGPDLSPKLFEKVISRRY